MAGCRYYSEGICYSPLTIKTYGKPSSEPVDPNICLTERYKECKYYVETGEDKEELFRSIGIGKAKDYYPPVHIVPCEYTSSCPFYKLVVFDEEKGLCAAYCEISERYIVKSSIKRCIENWRNCPFYKIGLEVTI